MYGNDEQRASWSASHFENSSRELDLSLGDSFAYNNNFFNHSTRYPTNNDSTCLDISTDSQPLPNPYERVSDASPHLECSRISSHYAPSPVPRDTLNPPSRSPRASSGQSRPKSTVTSCTSRADSELISPTLHINSLPTPPHSRPSSSVRRTDSPLPDPALNSLPPGPSSSLAPPQSTQTPSSSTSTRQQPKLSPPSSKTSLVPSEGEDLDSFHVRSTYAQLDTTGVKGDGYEDGVERTRARQHTRASQLRADATLGSPAEKSRDLRAEEVNVLASLDRYGFFTIVSHDRLVRLPAPPLLKRLSPVTAGPKTAPSQAVPVTSLPPPSSPSNEAKRIAKWGRMMVVSSRDRGGNVESWGTKPSKAHKLRRRVYKGIPDRWRSAAWEVLMNNYSKSGYDQIVKLGERYRSDIEKPSSYDIQIDLDVPRTISGHVLFRTRYGQGQRSLFHVLHSLSLQCEQCGYVQGMGPIAATLLCYFTPEKVYAALTRLHSAYGMHSVFSPGFPGLLENIYVQERVMQLKIPDVYAAFKKHAISTTSYATKWYITLFANSVPFQTQLRLWDAFLLDGPDIFVAVAVAIVWVYRDHITSGSANFETVLSLLSSFFVPEDEDTLLSWVEDFLDNKKLRAQMHSWRQDWHQLVASGRDGSALL
ncbi:rab-GTPase-TBC domain-containing protein [Boletus edulis BED1]|uniref:Rab-GTPase-TBC domain-containing protein n=1 Tax=Boletus edulis BED1 TaxID=1328754 RepID=A0AAD4BLB3_BOLED|nr:rab-GTPase-TBC domain-containing protein [Boletus edulis BED1]